MRRSPENKVFADRRHDGGLEFEDSSCAWNNINSDAMRPAKTKETGEANPNLPHVDGRYAKFGDHVDDFVAGFEDYAKFLLSQSGGRDQGGLFDGFAGLPVRKVVRPTRFYYMLLQRLKNHRSMDDGVIWSAQADFLARLADWERDSDPLWPLQRAERAALLALNVPHFVSPSDGRRDSRCRRHLDPTDGDVRASIARALACRSFDAQDIAWQVEVIRQNTAALSQSDSSAGVAAPSEPDLRSDAADRAGKEIFACGSRQDRRRDLAGMPSAAGRARPGSGSIGWAIPRSVQLVPPRSRSLQRRLRHCALSRRARAR